jgi:hypothetical protein
MLNLSNKSIKTGGGFKCLGRRKINKYYTQEEINIILN